MGTISVAVIGPILLLVGFAALISVSIIDAAERRIPNAVTYPAGICCVVAAVVGLIEGHHPAVASAVSGGACFVLTLYGIHRLQPASMGMGDVKLAWPLGFAIGWLQGGVATSVVAVGWTLAGASLLGLVVALVSALTRGEKIQRGQTVAFGPPLSIAGAVAVLLSLV